MNRWYYASILDEVRGILTEVEVLGSDGMTYPISMAPPYVRIPSTAPERQRRLSEDQQNSERAE